MESILIVGGSGIIGTELTKISTLNHKVHVLDIKERKKKCKCVSWETLDCTNEQKVNNSMKAFKKNKIVFSKVFINAGGASLPYEDYIANISELSKDNWHNIINGNLDIPFLIIKHLLKYSLISKKASITITSSIHSIIGPRFETYKGLKYKNHPMSSSVAYSVAKSGVNGLVKYLAAYFSNTDIRINAILVGGIFSGQSDLFVKRYSKHVPLGRMAKKEEVATAILEIGSNNFSYLNGQLIQYDGGKSSW